MKKILLSISVFVLLVVSMVFVLKTENTQSFEMKNVKNQEPIKQKEAIKQERPVKKEEKSIEKELPSADYELKRVAAKYEAQSVYPEYSVPISGNEHLLERNKNYPVERQYNKNNLEGAVAINMDKFRYEEGDVAEAEAVVEGNPTFISSIKEVYGIVDDKKIDFSYIDGGDVNFYTATIDTSDFSGEKNLKFYIDLHGNDKILQTIPFEVYSPIGKVTGVGSTKIEDNNLIIPVKVSLDKQGFYRISGNLYYKETQRPLTHLQGKKYIRSSGSNTIELKVYGKHFVDNDMVGDFILKDLELRRQPTKPGPDTKTEYGAPTEEEFEIKGVDPDNFSDTPYSDPLIQARVEFLNTISN